MGLICDKSHLEKGQETLLEQGENNSFLPAFPPFPTMFSKAYFRAFQNWVKYKTCPN